MSVRALAVWILFPRSSENTHLLAAEGEELMGTNTFSSPAGSSRAGRGSESP